MSLLDLEAAFGKIANPNDAAMLGAFRADCTCHIGVAAFPAGSRFGFWERHEAGDELLVVLAGRMTFTVCHRDGREEVHDARPGTVLFLPRGAAHTARIVEDIRVFFVTPAEGNVVWQQ